jgi:hypothetical protein
MVEAAVVAVVAAAVVAVGQAAAGVELEAVEVAAVEAPAAAVLARALVVVMAEVEEVVPSRSARESFREMSGLPVMPRPASAWHPREHSPSASRLRLSSD